ncbi:MAG TPA: hypothetical protein VK421_11875 [Pyrinomonadaceae bacterium]|nr:hypothetical protein [Pyrinomonadaceae bacterium]
MKLSPAKVLTAIYLLAAGFATSLHVTFRPPDEVAWAGAYGLAAIWVLTLPWSVALTIFAWGLINDSTHPVVLIFFAISAAANAYLIHRATA